MDEYLCPQILEYTSVCIHILADRSHRLTIESGTSNRFCCCPCLLQATASPCGGFYSSPGAFKGKGILMDLWSREHHLPPSHSQFPSLCSPLNKCKSSSHRANTGISFTVGCMKLWLFISNLAIVIYSTQIFSCLGSHTLNHSVELSF